MTDNVNKLRGDAPLLFADRIAAADEIVSLRARLAEAEKDADRYVWLRDTATGDELLRIIEIPDADEWDRTIDTFLKGGKP